MDKRPLAVIAIFFIFGIVLARFLPDSVGFSHIFIVTLIFILSAVIFSRIDSRLPSGKAAGFRGNDKEKVKTRRIANIFLLLSITSFAALLYVNSNIFPNNHLSHFLEKEKLKTSIVGTIKSPALTRKPYYGKISSTYLFEIQAIKCISAQATSAQEDSWLNVKGLAQIRIQTEKDYQYGDRLLVRGAIRRPVGDASRLRSKNNNVRAKSRTFNYREYLERQNIFALINTRENNVTVLSRSYKSNPILKFTYSIREKLKDQIIDKMPLETGAFLRAILLGDRSELPKHIQNSFKKSGTVHVLAISGLHIGIIALVILYFFRLLGLKREFSYGLTILFLIFFAFLTLSRPSVVRAVVMASIFLTGMLLGKKVDVYNSLGAAAIFILARNPNDISNVGFQLSFAAVLSILFFTPKFMMLVKEGTNFYIKRYLYTPLAVSISAWAATAPLIWHYFKVFTPIAIIANLFIIPGLFALLIAGMGFLLLGWMPFIGGLLTGLNDFLCQVIFFLTTFFANFNFTF
ncbi:MAG: ComEC family competence protein [Candidatus Omnitrophica bacterium]|nr:ComEC family competence protein [Candidatus Omnitrophota bacterium]